FYEHEFGCKEIDKIVAELFLNRWVKKFIIPPPLEHIWTLYRLAEERKDRKKISYCIADNLKYPLLPEDCLPEVMAEIRQQKNSDVVFPVFLTLEDKRILMFRNPDELNAYNNLHDYQLIFKNQIRDIKGCLCKVKVKPKPIERANSKSKPATEEFNFQPERISTVMDAQSLIEELYKYAIFQSRRITFFSIRGYLEPGKSCDRIYEHISSAETATEIEQMILDDIFDTNFTFSSPTDEEIIKFYITFCGYL
ncbi:MAG: hypothetical protein LWY06_14380, partial [Firmicutes bacterium]|nr:hypothetical protein [Bacillota bacterium]